MPDETCLLFRSELADTGMKFVPPFPYPAVPYAAEDVGGGGATAEVGGGEEAVVVGVEEGEREREP